MSRSPYGPFDQIDFPATSRLPAGSAFDATMPVDLQIEEINQAVNGTIPRDISTGFARHTADSEVFVTIEPTSTIKIVRQIGLGDALDPIQERRDFERREFIIAALAQRGVTCAQVLYYLDRGNLNEYSVVGRPIDGSNAIAELFASVNLKNEPDGYYYREHLPGTGPKYLEIEKTIANDFLKGLAERQSGTRAPKDELALLQQLYAASPYKIHTQEGNFIVKCRTGIMADITAEMQTITRGERVVKSYLLKVANELPSGDSVSLAVKLGQSRQNKRQHPAAQLSMTITDTPENQSSPAGRAITFESILSNYREHPEIFFSALANAAECLAVADIRAT